MDRRANLKTLAVAAAAALAGFSSIPAFAQAGNTIKVGVLHSLSGTMA
ncbi:MAG: urea ABC transporter substrate-binding protein, partial [Burkholderiaceae bacterium]